MWKLKNSTRLQSEIGLQLWRTWMTVCTLRSFGRVLENIRASVIESLSHYELKQHKPQFDEECSELLDQIKQAKLQWMRN
jgi:hypothetical protein